MDKLWREAAEAAEEYGIDPLSLEVAGLKYCWISELHSLGLTSRAIEETEKQLRHYYKYVEPKVGKVELELGSPLAQILGQMMQFEILLTDVHSDPMPDREAADETNGKAADMAVGHMIWSQGRDGGSGKFALMSRKDLGEMMGGKRWICSRVLH